MPLIDRLRQELTLAGKTAQRALDEGRVRLDLYRARQSVDRFAQRFGYLVYRAKKAGSDLPPEEYTAHISNLVAAEAEVARLEAMVTEAAQQRSASSRSSTATASSEPGSSGSGSTPSGSSHSGSAASAGPMSGGAPAPASSASSTATGTSPSLDTP